VNVSANYNLNFSFFHKITTKFTGRLRLTVATNWMHTCVTSSAFYKVIM